MGDMVLVTGLFHEVNIVAGGQQLLQTRRYAVTYDLIMIIVFILSL